DQPILRAQSKEIVFQDGADHARLRVLVVQAFARHTVENLRPELERHAQAVLELFRSPGKMDVIADFAAPFPALVIDQIVGVSPEDRKRGGEWVPALVMGRGIDRSADVADAASKSASEFDRYFRGLAADRRHKPTTDLLSSLCHAQEQGARLSDEQLV